MIWVIYFFKMFIVRLMFKVRNLYFYKDVYDGNIY